MSNRVKNALVFGIIVELSFCGLLVLGLFAGFNPVCSSGTTPLGIGLVLVGVIGHWPTGFLLIGLLQESSTRLFGVGFIAIWQALLWSGLYWLMAAFWNAERDLKGEERIDRIQQWTARLEAAREKL